MSTKSRKKDINSSVVRPGSHHTWRYNGNAVTVDFGVSATPRASSEIRKLSRDPSSPTTKREKPYLNLKQLVQGVRGGMCYAHQSSGLVHNVRVGDLQGDAFSSSPNVFNTYMGFPNGSPRYTIPADKWPMNPDLLSQAEVKAYAALRNKYGEMDLDSYLSFGLWYGERKETASLVRDAGIAFMTLITSWKSRSAQGMVDAVYRFRVSARRKQVSAWARREIRRQSERTKGLSTAMATLDFVNRSILVWNLGISPLLNDLDRTYRALRYDTVQDPSKLEIKAKGWVQRQEVNSELVTTDRGHVKLRTRVNHLSRYTSVLVARPSLTDRALLERMGLANPVSLIAELTSCSFLLNYVWSILDYLKALSTPMAFEFVDGSWSKKISHLCWVDMKSSSSSGNRVATGSWSHLEYERKVYTKFPFPIPPMSFRGQDLEAKQALNVATITWSRVRKALGS